jgi:D-alanyl-D-alanine carboxypeptidase/D-alanyl-D-alanine-endopeptidase (penicillin-binding protein 4)
VVVLALAVASYQLDLGPRWFGFDYPSPVDEPAEVAPPPGLSLPEAAEAATVAAADAQAQADPDAVRRALARLLASRKLGREVAVAVAEVADGSMVYRHGETRVTPASMLKMLTAAAALETLGGDHRFRTTAVAGATPSRIVLVGGGDPLLARRPVAPDEAYPARADLDTLARATARALREQGRTRVRLDYDAGLFPGPAVSPDWEPSYVPDNVVTPVSALWVDEGREPGSWLRSADPARSAAVAFARLLEKRGVTVRGSPSPRAAAPESPELAAVESAPLSQIVRLVLDVSDNEGAEVLARHVALAVGEPASFTGAARAVEGTIAGLGITTEGATVLDGSGLARGNRLMPETLVELIAVAAEAEHPELRPVLTGLPVAGFTGSLATRFDRGDPAGLGSVRAKTGTLSRVHGLAGTVTTDDGVLLGFVVAADRVRLPDTLDARTVLDRMAAALAGCRCAA